MEKSLNKNLKKKLDRKHNILLVIIILSIVLRFIFALFTHNAGDGCWHLSAAKIMANDYIIPFDQEIGRDLYPVAISEPFWAPPVFHFFAAFFYKIFLFISFDLAEISMTLVSPIFGSLSIILVFLIGRKLFSEEVAFYSTIFFCFIPMNLYYSSLAHIDASFGFFVLLSVYLILQNRIFLGALFLGISILTKYNGIFVIPIAIFIVYMNNRKIKDFIVKSLFVSIGSLLIGSVWFLRNYLLIGNPVFPFLDFVFKNSSGLSFAQPSFFHLLNPTNYFSMYLEIFGVPLGKISSFFYFDIPFMGFFVIIWIIVTFVFFVPLLLGLVKLNYKDKKAWLMIIWVSSFLTLSVYYMYNVGTYFGRYLLPIVPVLSFVWAIGFINIKQKFNPRILHLLLFLIILGFIGGECLKIYITHNAWGRYDSDFDWVKQNTEENAMFYFQEQCLTYNIDRRTTWSIEKAEKSKGYIWVQDEKSDSGTNLLKNDFPNNIKSKYVLVYNNPITTTKIYKIV